MAKTRPTARRPIAVLRRKNMMMDQRKLDVAKSALGAATETAAVDAALDLVAFRSEVFGALDQLAEAGGFGAPSRARKSR